MIQGSILQYFRSSLSYRLLLKHLFCLLLIGRLRQVLLCPEGLWLVILSLILAFSQYDTMRMRPRETLASSTGTQAHLSFRRPLCNSY